MNIVKQIVKSYGTPIKWNILQLVKYLICGNVYSI